ncbi:MAG: hypothetical protein IJ242_13375 [Clostridia bacterium]|nr:hypothetical protein [Clostridia bacterium]
MKLALLLYPHSNIRYRASLLQIASEETRLVLRSLGLVSDVAAEEIGGAQFLTFDSGRLLTEREMKMIWQLSSVYMIFLMEDGRILPLESQAPDYIDEDLPLLLKYKGKTNEMFTDSMLTMALASSDFSRNFDAQLVICDPMAGKGTTPLLALRRGFHGIGIEIGRNNVDELAAYMDRYFEFHRIKYKHQQTSLTVRGKNGGTQHKWVFSDSAAHFKDGDTRSFRMICGDTRNALAFLKSGTVHLMVTDLPYGVQTGTAGRDDGLLGTVSQALPGWFDVIRPGGVLCMSFNTHTIRRELLVSETEKAGFSVVETGSLEHWVEQAIERDLVIAKKVSKGSVSDCKKGQNDE